MRYKTTKLIVAIILISIIASLPVCVYGQTVPIPDAGFRQCLIDNYPSVVDTNGEVIVAEAGTVTYLNCTLAGISDLSGVELFTNATGITFQQNDISSLPDLSNLRALETADFSGNKLSSLPDLSQNINLQYLALAMNNFAVFPDITLKTIQGLDFRNNSLQTIPDMSAYTKLTVLKISGNPLENYTSFSGLNLEGLSIEGTNLTTFPDFSTQRNLLGLDIGGNSQITTWPDLTNCTALEQLTFSFSAFQNIPDLSRYSNLNYIQCFKSQLDQLPPGISNLTQLETLWCNDNNLTSLPDLSNTKLGAGGFLNLADNHLTFEDLIPIVVGKNYSFLSYNDQTLPTEDQKITKAVGENFVIDIGIDPNVPDNAYAWYHDDVLLATTHSNTLTIANAKSSDAGVYRCDVTNPNVPGLTISWGNATLTVSYNPILTDPNLRQCLKETYPSLFDVNDQIIPEEADKVTFINCYNRGIESIEGIKNFRNVTELVLFGNSIENVDEISSMTKLKAVFLEQNQITLLPDLSLLGDLQTLNVANNSLTQFPDLSGNVNLQLLYFDNCGLTTIGDLSPLINLIQLSFSHNPLKTPPILRQNAKLERLYFANISTATFPDLSNNVLLTDLAFNDNPQFNTWPDITVNTKLQIINCSGNNMNTIPNLDIYPALGQLACSNNNLQSLPDLSMLKNLYFIDVQNNNLTSLPDLTQFNQSYSIAYVGGNHLTFRDLIPAAQATANGTFLYSSQSIPPQDKTTTSKPGETFILDINVDDDITDNSYTWYHDDVLLTITHSNTLTIANLKASDAGVYRCDITNPNLPDLTISWSKATLTVSSDKDPFVDPNFKQCLKETYPALFDANDQIIPAEANKITKIDCSNRGIESIKGIETFTNVTELFLFGNVLENVEEISSLSKMVTLNLMQNKITFLPDLSQMTDLEFLGMSTNEVAQFPELANNSTLKELYFANNNLTTTGDLGFLTNLEVLTLGDNPLKTLPSFEQNLKLTGLYFENTLILTFPDLSKNIALEALSFGGNPQFNTWPDITANTKLQHLLFSGNNMNTFPDLSIYPDLKSLVCSNNNFTSLSDLSLFKNLNYLDVASNNLTSLPDLTQFSQSDSPVLYIDGNYLTFEDLIPIIKLNTYTFFTYLPQRFLASDETITKKTGETFTLDINIDDNVTDNIYAWYHDDILLTTTHSDILTIENVAGSDAGVYRCDITNPNVPSLTIAWQKATLTVITCNKDNFNESDLTVQTTAATCIVGGKILISDNGNGFLLNTTFEVANANTGAVTPSLSPEIAGLADGEYRLTLTQNGCTREWPDKLVVAKDPCDNIENTIFSPDHDGVADNYYIRYSGTAIIYDASGVQVKQLTIPGSWDGTDDSGRALPMGAYVIKATDQQEFMVTLVR